MIQASNIRSFVLGEQQSIVIAAKTQHRSELALAFNKCIRASISAHHPISRCFHETLEH